MAEVGKRKEQAVGLTSHLHSCLEKPRDAF